MLLTELLVKRKTNKRTSKWRVTEHSSLSERLICLDIMTKLSPVTGWSKVPGGSLMPLCLSQITKQKLQTYLINNRSSVALLLTLLLGAGGDPQLEP